MPTKKKTKTAHSVLLKVLGFLFLFSLFTLSFFTVVSINSTKKNYLSKHNDLLLSYLKNPPDNILLQGITGSASLNTYYQLDLTTDSNLAYQQLKNPQLKQEPPQLKPLTPPTDFSDRSTSELGFKLLQELQKFVNNTPFLNQNDELRDFVALNKNQLPKVAIIGRFQNWADPRTNRFDQYFVNSVKKMGAIPYITWEPWAEKEQADPSNQPDFRLANIVEGKFDKYIKEYAKEAAKFNYPLFIRFAHEMNGHWYPWGGKVNQNTPEDYVAAWRHIHQIFKQEGAHNVIWVWSPNEPYGGASNQNSDLFNLYYPGDDYVDWVGFSAYNWGNYREYDTPRTFKEITDASYQLLSQYNKPLMISEINSANINVDKLAWIKEMKKTILDYPKIKAIVWYESEQQMPFKIEEQLFFQ